MRLDREAKRVLAQFLNALAVALLATLVLAPLAAGTLYMMPAMVAVGFAAILHIAALLIARQR